MSDKLLSKIDTIVKNIQLSDLCCPICKSDFLLHNKSLICTNNHTFDFNKKGYIKLIKNYKTHFDTIYTKELFSNRKKIISLGFYDELHNKIIKIIKDSFDYPIKVLDIGSGEGSHTYKIISQINLKNCYLTDITEEAIKMSTEFLSKQTIPIVCDAYNLPFKKCFDVILDILSPYNYQQVYSVLKDDGIIIKVIPTQNYLQELRKVNDMKSYNENKDVKANFEKHFKKVREEHITKSFSLSESQAEAFSKMTPLTETLQEIKLPKNITISLSILVGMKK